jgi:hypothetical protein
VVDDGRVRRLERRASQLGFDNLHRYLQTRCDAGHSVPGLAQELGESEWTITQAITTLGVVLPPRRQRLALQRRRHAEERIAGRVAALGFAEIRAYLADRLIEREWLLVDVAAAGPWSRGGRSSGCGPSFGSAATGWWRRWDSSACGDGADRLGRAGRGRRLEPSGAGADAAARRCRSAFGRASRGTAGAP